MDKSTVFGTTKSYTETKITEWIWKVEIEYELMAYRGNDKNHKIVILTQKAQDEWKIRSDPGWHSPVSSELPKIEANFTWLFAHLTKELAAKFKIDRKSSSCHTPLRNGSMERALSFFEQASSSLREISKYINGDLLRDHNTTPNPQTVPPIRPEHVFVPVLPIFEKKAKKRKGSRSPRPTSESSSKADTDHSTCSLSSPLSN